jgi:hypothetical protein
MTDINGDNNMEVTMTEPTTEPTKVIDLRPYMRLSGVALIELINAGDEEAVAEGTNRRSKAVQAAVTAYQERPLATITPLDPESS